jgi:glycosyltransferase involved in cell wall biosynthesis
MKILFLTLSRIDDISIRGIYPDLIRKLRDKGHHVYIVSPLERKFKLSTNVTIQDEVTILNIRTLNIQKTNVIEKGLGLILLELQFTRAINKFFGSIQFDLILYTTPPITITSVIEKVKKRTGAKTYLLLKDIFPQNAIDIGLMSKHNLMYHFFRNKEKKIYDLSDHIGCMSLANVNYILRENPQVSPQKVEVNPNSIEIVNSSTNKISKSQIRAKYNIPNDSIVYVYGGNLGKPQGLDFLLELIKANREKVDIYFLVVGSGTEYNRIKQWFQHHQDIYNAQLLPKLPKIEYDELVKACDVGLILLDPRFTIPNFPSRLLSYLENKMPVIAATDINSDIGKIAEENGFGFYVNNGDLLNFNSKVDWFLNNKNEISLMGESGYQYLLNHYQVDNTYEIMMKHM